MSEKKHLEVDEIRFVKTLAEIVRNNFSDAELNKIFLPRNTVSTTGGEDAFWNAQETFIEDFSNYGLEAVFNQTVSKNNYELNSLIALINLFIHSIVEKTINHKQSRKGKVAEEIASAVGLWKVKDIFYRRRAGDTNYKLSSCESSCGV